MGALDGRVAIVTGASRGLGRDITVALAAAGAAVVAAARTDAPGESRIPGSLADTVARVNEAGGVAVAARCDVTSEADIAATVATARERFGRVDVLVNNAGVLIPGAVMDLQARHWELIFRVNVHAPFAFCRAVIPVMAAGGGGHIINISSRAAPGPGPGPYDGPPRAGGTAYGTTKAALERFSQGLASEVYDRGISVNVLLPGPPIWSEGGHYFREQGGEPSYSGWRLSGEIIGDAAVAICRQEPGRYTGNIGEDEHYIQSLLGLSREEMLRRYPVEP